MSFSLILMIVAGVLIGFGALLGFSRGFGRALLRLFTVMVAFIGVLFACNYFLSNTESVLQQKTVVAAFEKLGMDWLDTLKETLPELYEILIALPLAAIAPVVFTVLFVVVSFLLLIVYGIIAAFALPKKHGRRVGFLSRLLGLAIGAAQGAVVTVALLLPLVGLLGTVGEAIDTVTAEQGDYENTAITQIAEYREQMTEVENSVVIRYASKFGGKKVCEALMTFSVKEEATDGTVTEVEINLHDEVIIAAKMYAHFMPMIGAEPGEYGAAQADAIKKLALDLGESMIYPRLLGGLLEAACSSWYEGESFLGIAPFAVEETFDEFLAEVYSTFMNSNATTIKGDLLTIADLFDVMAEHGLFAVVEDSETMQQKMSEPEVIDALMAVLNENPRTAHLAKVLMKIGMRAVCSELLQVPSEGDPAYEEYNAMVGEIADALNNMTAEELEAQITELSDQLNDALADYGIEMTEISSTVIETVSDAMLEEFGGNLGSVTPEQITAFLTGQVYGASGSEEN